MINDLRDYVNLLDQIGELKVIRGANWNLEMGGISEMLAERKGPALLFDEIKDYPKGFRVLNNVITTPRRFKVALDLPDTISDLEVVKLWKDRFNDYKPVPTVEVKTGPVMENMVTGDKVNMFQFPVPLWHELDGGRYIGTGVVNITRDPEENWINCGTYRVMVHDDKTVSFFTAPGKHAELIREKYWSKGQNCPVVMCFGQDIKLFILSGTGVPWGVSELEMAGFMRGKPVEVIKGPITGLPIPAGAEIAIEGFSPPKSVDSRTEGPFAEWTGYYASGASVEPVVYVKAVYFRNDPIIQAHLNVKPPLQSWWPIPTHTASRLWNRLEATGVQGIKGVYVHGPGLKIVAVISIKQLYLGHAEQVGMLAASLLVGGACSGRYVMVVDEDIPADDWDQVMWAWTTRVDPETAIQVIPGFISSPLDPMIPPEKREIGDYTSAKVLINACRPYHWRDKFPKIHTASKEQREEILKNWPDLFGK